MQVPACLTILLQAAGTSRLWAVHRDGVQYDDPGLQARARAIVPLDELEEQAAVALLKVLLCFLARTFVEG